MTGEAQILRFISGRTAKARGNRMHVHVDKPGTRWVAIATLGDTASFVVDRSTRCQRCWTGGGRGREDDERPRRVALPDKHSDDRDEKERSGRGRDHDVRSPRHPADDEYGVVVPCSRAGNVEVTEAAAAVQNDAEDAEECEDRAVVKKRRDGECPGHRPRERRDPQVYG